jgi:hypothetical protein
VIFPKFKLCDVFCEFELACDFNSLSGDMVEGFVFRSRVTHYESHNKRSVHRSLRLLNLQSSAL